MERGEHLLRRKEIYEWWHPETRAGAAQAASMNRAVGNNVADNLSATSFAADTAAKAGITDRDIRRSIKRARDIDEKVRDRGRAQQATICRLLTLPPRPAYLRVRANCGAWVSRPIWPPDPSPREQRGGKFFRHVVCR